MKNISGRLSGKIALITGASRGIGAAVAKHYAREGAHVIALARNVPKLEALDDHIKTLGGTCTLVPCDLLDGNTIDQLGQMLAERFGRLDVLVGNAAILGELSPLAHQTPGMWEKVMATNLQANWRLLYSLDPLLRQSPAGRVMFVTSGVAHPPMAYWGAYAVSKASLEAMTHIYAAEVAHSAIRVNIINPGMVATDMLAKAMPGLNLATVSQPEDITDIFVALAETNCTIHDKIMCPTSEREEV
jgi:NAD(P)-dependent dehydrogenase (short-subunit alcohol dehydrogenase family)